MTLANSTNEKKEPTKKRHGREIMGGGDGRSRTRRLGGVVTGVVWAQPVMEGTDAWDVCELLVI